MCKRDQKCHIGADWGQECSCSQYRLYVSPKAGENMVCSGKCDTTNRAEPSD